MKTVKIVFELEIEDGFPPIGTESLNALADDFGFFRIDNTPFFATGVSLGDVVEAESDDRGRLCFRRVIRQSDNTSLSIIFLDDQVRMPTTQYLEDAGCYCEYGEFPGLEAVAVSIPVTVNYENVVGYLDNWEARGAISYAELAIYDPSAVENKVPDDTD